MQGIGTESVGNKLNLQVKTWQNIQTLLFIIIYITFNIDNIFKYTHSNETDFGDRFNENISKRLTYININSK